jgi:DHA2 family multidrug resistance protein
LRFDWFGFGTLSLAIGALQILLNRGEMKDWVDHKTIRTDSFRSRQR